MAGNSFETPDGSHVTGAVAMAINAKGQAVPIEEDTPIGSVKIDMREFCRALAYHAVEVSKIPTDSKKAAAEEVASRMIEFATKKEAAQ